MRFFPAKLTKDFVQVGLLLVAPQLTSLYLTHELHKKNIMPGQQNNHDKNQPPSPMRRLL
ncbi:MAG TPA: hypothetical protein DCZ80_04185 [Legionellales bacterium]|nr:hypothetical protein [Legionellales bacterium]